jgi:hypothetical protein
MRKIVAAPDERGQGRDRVPKSVPIRVKISLQILPAEIRNMNKSRSLLAFLFVAAVLSLAASAPFLTRSHAQSVAPGASNAAASRTSNDPKITYPESGRSISLARRRNFHRDKSLG